MSNEAVRKTIIIGSGPAGLAASIYAARANLEPEMAERALYHLYELVKGGAQ